jgi:hypothetical protein
MEEIGGEIATRVMLMLLKAAADNRMDDWLDAHAADLLEVLEQEDGRGVVNALLRYICRGATGTAFSTVREKLANVHSTEVENEMMTIADELMEKGMEKGDGEGDGER